ncbi:MAG: hypothetical protein KKB79_03270 [Nanoarchaeota archaeon]|nr:hypothetical protein [Nanoarchaeota archaeon]
MDKDVVKIATRENLLEIMKDVKMKMGAVRKIIDDYGVFFSNKNLSEMIGKIMEKTASEHFSKKMGYEVKNALTDKEPDLFFTKIDLSMEIKMTSTKNAWTGGEFSKRPFHYFLVSWGEEFDHFFVCCVKLEKEDWKSNMSNNYYGPSLSMKKLNSLNDKIVLVGSIDEKGRMVREKV